MPTKLLDTPFFRTPKPKIYPDILSHVGGTPMVRINKITEEYGVECQMREYSVS